jgi:membrane protease YdiL (CAAX protease family)
MTHAETNGEAARPAEGGLARLQRVLRDSRVLILLDLICAAGVFVADKVYHVIWLSETLYLFALGVLSLLLRGVKWREIGWSFGPNTLWMIGAGLVGGALIEAQELYFTQPLLIAVTGRMPDLSDFRGIRGNWGMVALGVPFIWVLAAFGEEWVYRGWLTNRLADLFGRKWTGWLIAVVIANLVFGLAHLYQGPIGMVEAGVDGLLFAILYFATGRNLIAPMIAHGVQDSIDLILGFTGHYPIPI